MIDQASETHIPRCKQPISQKTKNRYIRELECMHISLTSEVYVITNKSEANGASSFTAPSSIDGVTGITVTTVANAVGGADAETIQSIKLNAPLDYATQGRCVTVDDYKTYTKKLFANTQAVSVWGGEDGSYDTSTGVSSNPEYGKVSISIKSTTGENAQ